MLEVESTGHRGHRYFAVELPAPGGGRISFRGAISCCCGTSWFAVCRTCDRGPHTATQLVVEECDLWVP